MQVLDVAHAHAYAHAHGGEGPPFRLVHVHVDVDVDVDVIEVARLGRDGGRDPSSPAGRISPGRSRGPSRPLPRTLRGRPGPSGPTAPSGPSRSGGGPENPRAPARGIPATGETMKSRFASALRAVDGLLASMDVEYVLIGGQVAIFHGSERTTRDVDLAVWVPESRDNRHPVRRSGAGRRRRGRRGRDGGRACRAARRGNGRRPTMPICRTGVTLVALAAGWSRPWTPPGTRRRMPATAST